MEHLAQAFKCYYWEVTPPTFPFTFLLAKASHITISEFKGVWKMVGDFSNACCTISWMVLKIQRENPHKTFHSFNKYLST